jgi:hypothetical protein
MLWGFCYLRIFKKVQSISGRSLLDIILDIIYIIYNIYLNYFVFAVEIAKVAAAPRLSSGVECRYVPYLCSS